MDDVAVWQDPVMCPHGRVCWLVNGELRLPDDCAECALNEARLPRAPVPA